MTQIEETALQIDFKVNHSEDFSLSFIIHQNQFFSKKILIILKGNVDLQKTYKEDVMYLHHVR